MKGRVHGQVRTSRLEEEANRREERQRRRRTDHNVRSHPFWQLHTELLLNVHRAQQQAGEAADEQPAQTARRKECQCECVQGCARVATPSARTFEVPRSTANTRDCDVTHAHAGDDAAQRTDRTARTCAHQQAAATGRTFES